MALASRPSGTSLRRLVVVGAGMATHALLKRLVHNGPSRTLANTWRADHSDTAAPLGKDDANAPNGVTIDNSLLAEWADTAHAAIGVNCTERHLGDDGAWSDTLTHCFTIACSKLPLRLRRCSRAT